MSRAGDARLSDDGVFIRWIQAYEGDSATITTVLATFASVFPHVEVWETLPGDFMRLGSRRPVQYRVSTLTAQLNTEPFRSALRHTWRAVDINGILAHFVADDRTVRALVSSSLVPINTDDRNLVEFGFGRSLGQDRLVNSELRAFTRRAGGNTPSIIDTDPLDWDAIETQRVAFQMATRPRQAVETVGSGEAQSRQAALILYYRDRDLEGAWAAWTRQSKGPANPTELAMMADLEALRGADDALSLIGTLRTFEPTEADTILAGFHLRAGRVDEAAVAIEKALIGFRTDPWALTKFKLEAIGLAAQIVERQNRAATRLFPALVEPFAVHAADDARMVTAAFMTRAMDFAANCQRGVGALEPHVPWTANFLTLRRDYYAASKDPRLDAAVADLRRFLSREAAPLIADVQ